MVHLTVRCPTYSGICSDLAAVSILSERRAAAAMKETFEENDAGFEHILSIKGQAAYDYHTQKIQEKINVAKTREECLPVLQEWQHEKPHAGCFHAAIVLDFIFCR